jgi:hypothetical protein
VEELVEIESNSYARTLPGISEVDEEVEEEELDDDEDCDYEEVEVQMNGSQSVFSGTEVELVDDDDEYDDNNTDQFKDCQDDGSLFEEVLEDDDVLVVDGEEVVEYVDDTVRDDSEVEEVTVREIDDGDDCSPLAAKTFPIQSECTHGVSPKSDSRNIDDDDDDDENDGASAEELTEAIEYVLRQEKAVSKFILTEEQAETMAHLPTKVMKVIVDHLESCDNESTPIDWDFLLKIVLPFCDE